MQPVELEKVPREVWRHLIAGNGAWRIPVLASAAPGGGGDARTVVLRSVSAEQRELVFFTDRRSRKSAQLQADPGVCAVVYDDERRLQVRLYGRTLREHDAATLDKWWNGLNEQQRVHYAIDVPADGPVGEHEKGRENFAAFRMIVERFHCLWIHDTGTDAAEFNWRDGQWRGHIARP